NIPPSQLPPDLRPPEHVIPPDPRVEHPSTIPPMPPTPIEPRVPVQPKIPVPPPHSSSDWFRKQASSWAGNFTKGLGGCDNETLKGLVEAMQRNGLMPGRVELPSWIKDSTTGLPTALKNWLPDLGPAPQLGGFSLGDWSVGVPSVPELPSAQTAT